MSLRINLFKYNRMAKWLQIEIFIWRLKVDDRLFSEPFHFGGACTVYGLHCVIILK